MSTEHVGDDAYWDRLVDLANDKHIHSLLYRHLVNMDVSGFCAAKIPRSRLRAEIQASSQLPIAAFLQHVVSSFTDATPRPIDGVHLDLKWALKDALYTELLAFYDSIDVQPPAKGDMTKQLNRLGVVKLTDSTTQQVHKYNFSADAATIKAAKVTRRLWVFNS